MEWASVLWRLRYCAVPFHLFTNVFYCVGFSPKIKKINVKFDVM